MSLTKIIHIKTEVTIMYGHFFFWSKYYTYVHGLIFLQTNVVTYKNIHFHLVN